MTWLSILFFIAKHIPDLIQIIQKIIELIHGLPHEERVQAREELSEAIKANDLVKVREIATHWHQRCEGVGCPMDLVGE